MHERKEQPEKAAGLDRAVSPAQRPGTNAPLAAGSLSPQAIVALQRTIGNEAVAQMIEQQQDGQPVQRSMVPGVLRSPGRPLEEPVRAEMEERLGADFSDVRVHDDLAAQRSATEIGARAYTSGHHVVIGDGGGDRHTLAHELVHVVQQRLGPVPGTDNGSGLSVSDPSDRFEREAEHTARRAMSGEATAPVQRMTAGPASTVQRAPGTAVQRVNGTTPNATLSPYEAGKYTPGAAGTLGTVAPGNRAATLEKIVWKDHWARISAVCKKYHYTIAVRETGEFSIKRIAEGAKPKPHTILEKSIKPSSVKKAHGSEAAEVLSWLEHEDLDGFVGHWSEAGLIGVRIDNPPKAVRDLEIVQTGARGVEFVPLTVRAPGGGPALTTLKRNVPNWKQYLYTGDYDLHEAYSAWGAMAGGGQIAEASAEKANLLNRLNAGIAYQSAEAVRRTGKAIRGDHGLHMKNSEYAMFQHGDQATYRENQYMEARAEREQRATDKMNNYLVGAQLDEQTDEELTPLLPKEDETEAERDEWTTDKMRKYLLAGTRRDEQIQEEMTPLLPPPPLVAKLVRAVATESDEPMGWCRWGDWYVTMNRAEHAVLRQEWGLVTPNTWSPEAVKRTDEGGYRTAEYTA